SSFEGHLSDAWLTRLEREHGNLRAALTWSQGVAADLEASPRLAGGLWKFWCQHGHFVEGRQWLERALGERATPAVRARMLGGAGALAYYQGDFGRASAYLEASLALWRQVDEPRGVGWVLHRLALLAESRGEYERAAALCAESVALWRELDDRSGLAYALVPSA